MVVIIEKEASQEEIKANLKKIKPDPEKPKLIDFFGKMKDRFGDGLSYQKNLRNE